MSSFFFQISFLDLVCNNFLTRWTDFVTHTEVWLFLRFRRRFSSLLTEEIIVEEEIEKLNHLFIFFLARQLTPRLILENGGRDTRRHMSFRSFYVSGFYFYFNFFFCILERPQDPIRSLEFAHLFVCWKKKIIGKKHFHFIFADFFFFANEFRPSRDVPQLSELMESLFVFKE